MANDIIIQGSVGARIEVTLTVDGAVEDLTGKAITFLYQKPDGTRGSWAATLVDAAAGLARYTTTSASDLDQAGLWQLQPRISGSGETLYADVVSFRVAERLE